jgi:ketosteroid isomerase-like protein
MSPTDSIKIADIQHHESQLLAALKGNDIATLNALLHENLLFNIPNGQTITKTMDLEDYRSGNVRIDQALATQLSTQIFGDTAIVAVTVSLVGSYYGQQMDGEYRYLRVWKKIGAQLQVIGGSSIRL